MTTLNVFSGRFSNLHATGEARYNVLLKQISGKQMGEAALGALFAEMLPGEEHEVLRQKLAGLRG